jgi:hypothetical protein
MGVEAGHRDAGRGVSGVLEAGARQFDFCQDRLDAERGRDVLQRDMRRYPRVPDLLEHVELANLAGKADHIRHEADFVVIARIGVAHRLLVERREADRLRSSLMGKFERGAEIGGGKGAAGKRRLPAHDIRRIEMAEIDEDVAGIARGLEGVEC